ncbi:MAG: hypothetical protein Q7Q71_16255 [Verrucomicrobiota bacterium JB023]|nr:hypothetical protein [Verrucomicrobiota bacterium JB023]
MSSSPKHRNRSSVLEALRHAASTFASHRALVLLLRSVKYVLAAFLLICLADALAHFATGTRLGLVVAIGSGILLLALIGLGIACFARPKAGKMATILERRDPNLGSKLTNILELHDQTTCDTLDPLTRDLARQAVADATRDIDTSQLRQVARAPFLKKEFRKALILLGIFAALPLLLGEPGRRQFLRLLHPYGDYPPLSFTWLDITRPNDDALTVVYGEDTRIEVTAKGHLPKELVLTTEPSDGSAPPRRLPMTTKGDGIFVTVVENIEQPLRLTATTPNERSRSKHRYLSVLLNPRIEKAWLTITPPPYTGLPAVERPFRFDGVQALEGSLLTFRLQSNRPLGNGSLRSIPTEGALAETPLRPVADGQANEALADLTVAQSGRLHFDVRDEQGREAEDAISSSLTVSQDLPPAISFLNPTQDSFIVSSHSFEVELAASDDYGVRTIRLLPAVNDAHLAELEETYPEIGPRRATFKRLVNLQDLGARPGDVVTFFAEAIDNCPEPHLTRTKMRRLEVISPEQYQDYLRKEATVAQVAASYEEMLARLDSAAQRQQEIADAMEDLAQRAQDAPLSEEDQEKLDSLRESQNQLNEEIRDLATEMESFADQTPIYDFEEQMQEAMNQMAQELRESVEKNEQSNAGNPSPADSAEAAREQEEKLSRQRQQGQEQVEQPLEDLAALHELINDVSEFQALYEEQKTLSEQTARFENQPNLSSADRLSLNEMAGRQREVASRLQNLQEELRNHADAAEENFPKAAQSARDLAGAIDQANMPGLGRASSQSMLQGKGEESHDQATRLKNEMERLMSQCSSCQGEGQSELDNYLQLFMGNSQGNNFQQMMDSLCFNPGQQGGAGMGQGGSLALGSLPGQQMGLMGGRSLMMGPIARALASGQGARHRSGSSGDSIAKVDASKAEQGKTASTRQSTTPESQGLLQEYENLTEAYFRTLTTSPDSSQ